MNKKLFKSASDVKIDGVCGGIGAFLGIDSTVIRLLWVVFALSGWGILAYFICSAVMPRMPKDGAPGSGESDYVDYRKQQ